MKTLNKTLFSGTQLIGFLWSTVTSSVGCHCRGGSWWMSNCGPALLGMFGWDVAVSNFWLEKKKFLMFFVRNCVAERKSYCIGSFTSELLETDCRVLPTLPFKEEYNIMLPLYRKKVHRKVVGKWYCQILSAGSQLNTIKLLQTVCSMRILLYFIAACEEQGSAKMYDYISYLYYPAKVHVALLQFWTWCLLEVVFANGWVPLLIVVTRPSGGHCRQSWDAVGVNSPSYLLSHHVTSSLLQNWKLVMYMIYVFIYIYLSLSLFILYIYVRHPMIFFLVISFMFFFLVFHFADDTSSGSNSSGHGHWHERHL